MLLPQYRLLCFGLPPHKADLDLYENFVTPIDAPYPGYDGDMLKGGYIDSLYSDLDSRELEPLHRQFKQSKSPDSLEGEVNIPTLDTSYGMGDRTQGSNLTWDDSVLISVIRHEVLMMILHVLLLSCITAVICCWCTCLGLCYSFLCGFY
jgi:hypothetical protein